MRAAADYQRGTIGVDGLLDAADAATDAMRKRLADGSLDETARDRADSVFARTVLLAQRGWAPSGDLNELITIHRGLFEGVFDDAGKLRTSDVARGKSDDRARAKNPEAFFPAALIETGAHNIAVELAEHRNLQTMDRADVVPMLAHIMDELGYLHPFRGGNAMTLRIFLSRLAHDAGWDLDWGTVTREEYKAAKHAAYRGDTSGFARMFDRIARPANPTRVFLIAGFEQGPAH